MIFWHLTVSNRAVDGNLADNYFNKSCIHTKHEETPWLVVDLYGYYTVTHVKIKNRRDCCSE